MEIKKEVYTNKGFGMVEFNRKEAEYVRDRLMHLAKEAIKSKPCRCGHKDRKAVPLFEFGDPYIPSQVVLFCPSCKRTEVFATRPINEARYYAELNMGKAYDGKKISQQERANKAIEAAIAEARKPKPKVESQENVIKDENNDIIASKEEVAKRKKKK